MTLAEYCQAVIGEAAKATGRPESDFKVNEDAVRPWFESGIDPYYCFRENFEI